MTSLNKGPHPIPVHSVYVKLTLFSHRSHKELFDYFWHANDHFHPRPRAHPRHYHLVQPVENGNITPLPDPQEVSSLTPAWDPSSRTPGWTPKQLPSPPAPVGPPASTWTSADSDAPTEQTVSLEHVLFDPRLLNTKLKVKFMGGAHENKEAAIASSLSNG